MPVVTSIAPNTVTCRLLPGVTTVGRVPRSVQLARTCGSRFRWVSSSASTTARRGSSISRAMRPATTWSWYGSPRAVSLGRRQIATRRTRRYKVRMLTCGQSRYRWIRGSAQGPGRPSSAAILLASRVPPRSGRPHRGRSASPAIPPLLNRPIQRRTVAGWHSSSTAIWAAGNPCSDSSTITARDACRHWPRRSARSRSISSPGPLANTQTGRILTTTSPGGGTLWQPRSNPRRGRCQRPITQQPRPWLRAELMDRRLAGPVHLDKGCAPGTRVVRADRPGRAIHGRHAAEDPVAAARVRRGDPLPARPVVAGDHGELVAAGLVQGRPDEPHGVSGDGDAADVGEPGTDPGRQLCGPAAVVQVQDQRAGLVGGVVRLAHGPHLMATHGDPLQQPGCPGGRGVHDGPGVAVPVLHQRRIRTRVVALADGPDVVRPGGGHPEQLVARVAGVRAGHHRPARAVPVFDQRAEPAVPALLLPDGPHIMRGGGGG